MPRPRLSHTEAVVAQLKFDLGLRTSVGRITDCNCDEAFQTCCNGYSAPVSYGAPVGAAPTFQGAKLSLQFVWLKQFCRG